MTQKNQNAMPAMRSEELLPLQAFFNQFDIVTFGFLFGSRVAGDAREQSDWDFALWVNEPDDYTRLGLLEDLRSGLSSVLGGAEVDVVDLQRASLSIADTAVSNGVVIKGKDRIELKNYYTRIWALAEDFDWRRRHEFELYQEQTLRLADYHESILLDAAKRLKANQWFSPMEEQGLLHSLQVLIENSVGKAKHLLKSKGLRVPAAAYDAFVALELNKIITREELALWKKAIGLRNAIVHEYMQLDMDIVTDVISKAHYNMMLEFLRQPIK